MSHPAWLMCAKIVKVRPCREVAVTTLLPLLGSAEREALTCLGRSRRFARGRYLLLQGEQGDNVTVIIRGRVKISTVTADGDDRVCAVHGPGSVIGHFEALDSDGLGRTASATAIEAVDCLIVDGADFRAFLHDHPDAALALLRATVRELRAADRRRADVASGDIARHLARVLLEQVEMRNGPGETNGELGFGLTQAELAGILSASRAAIVRALSTLRQQGAVSTSPRQIVVTDFVALREAAR
jgi:CRP/FNR family cyclic AMP-dependent transcriptional regulator